MDLRIRAGFVLALVPVLAPVLASCERSAQQPPAQPAPALPASSASSAGLAGSAGSGAASPTGSAAEPAAVAPAVSPVMPRMPQVPPSGSASDDLPSRRQEFAWLATVGNCVPPSRIDKSHPMELEVLSLALDSFDGHLVLCAQSSTRRDVSVFFDDVSYACWNVDPATAALSRRSDLGRSYFRCQDGACPPGETFEVISRDGTERLVYDDTKQELSLFTRPGGALVRSFPFPSGAGQAFWRDTLTLVGHTIFMVTDKEIHVLDDRGKAQGKLSGSNLNVIDEGAVLAFGEDRRATLYDLATRKSTPIALTSPYLAGAVRHGGAFYAVNSRARKLVTLDPKTLQPRRTLPLRICK
jgi:hypothetical protein